MAMTQVLSADEEAKDMHFEADDLPRLLPLDREISPTSRLIEEIKGKRYTALLEQHVEDALDQQWWHHSSRGVQNKKEKQPEKNTYGRKNHFKCLHDPLNAMLNAMLNDLLAAFCG